jgi:superfamily I DNA and RNA helicase
MSSYFFLQAKQTEKDASFIKNLKGFAERQKNLTYILDSPLTDSKYSYKYSQALIILSPKNKIVIINFEDKDGKDFDDYVDDVIEDVGSISDKYNYKDVIGRTRKWRASLLETFNINNITTNDLSSFFDKIKLTDDLEIKKIDLLISLFTGSINDIDRVKEEVPVTILDKVKQKILLFDGDQTRFIYEEPTNKKIRIQGLSGTGKTELLLHKLKDLYVKDNSSKIFFTCFNKILADNLRKRIPSFFNFMKVEQQIEWDSRLWCTHAWGSGSSPNTGAYRYICDFYQIPFYRYSYQMSFSKACQLAIDEIKDKQKEGKKYAFTYMFIDESQDFDEKFFDLCELVTEKTIYIAGDIFQSIFDEQISSTISPDFLLSRCYRTDPKTLMFAHAMGMGLFEKNKLRWLEEKEWKDCGYKVDINNSKYFLSREPIRRFEDLDVDFKSIIIGEITNSFSDTIIRIIKQIKEENSTVQPDDIGIILLDQTKDIYELADIMEVKIEQNFDWTVNKAYESKEKIPNTILISNRNNVKGLEFPFVICITKGIINNLSYRNSLYTMLTRSFIQSYLLIQPKSLTQEMKDGWKEIITNSRMIIQEPSAKEKVKIRTRFKNSTKRQSFYDLMHDVFKNLKIDKRYHEKFFKLTQEVDMQECDEETLFAFIKDNMKYICKK